MRSRGLGRGLAALIAETQPEETEASVQEIPLDQVVPNPYQPRTQFDAEKMEELIASVREQGILQPVLLRRIGPSRYQLVAGERRYRAAQAVGLTAIPALVRECNEREMLEMAVVENVQREDIGAMEAARAYRRLNDEFGLTHEAIAQRVGKNRVSITNTLRLLHLPKAIQDSIDRGEITEGHAKALLMAKEEAAILRVWQIVLSKNLSVRATEMLIEDLIAMHSGGTIPRGEKETRPRLRIDTTDSPPVSDPNETAIVAALEEALQTKVSLQRRAAGDGKIEIKFFSAEELERLVELLISRKGLE
ncbi:MAG TPA: ParB/RepB/Spo0J family partition protein [Chthonomonadaceae bacterium]|nr:ParB/RepB/Spo0J family partition protein [Chthonomonadaceae bacterium]